VDDEDEMDGWAQKESDEEDGSTMSLSSQLTPQNVFTDSPTWPHSFLLNMLHPDLEGFTPREELSSDANLSGKTSQSLCPGTVLRRIGKNPSVSEVQCSDLAVLLH
jgi:hypothetical protein